MFSGNILCSWH